MRRKIFTILIAGLVSGPAQADFHTFDGCDIEADEYMDIVLPILDGTWQASHGAGIMLAQGAGRTVSFPIPVGDTQTAIIQYMGENTAFVTDGAQAVHYEVSFTDSAALGDYGLPDELVPEAQDVMDFDALGDEVPNCSSDVLPTITYSGEMAQDGIRMNFEAILHVVTADLMSGIFIFNGSGPDGGQVHGRRFLTLRR